MVLRKIAETGADIHTVKNKIAGIIAIVIGIIIVFVGLIITIFVQALTGGIFILIGLVAIFFGYVGIKRARKNAEVESGLALMNR